MFRYHSRESQQKRWLIGGSLILCATLALLCLRAGDTLARWSFDLPFLLRGDLGDTNVVVVIEDRAALDALGETSFPPKRTVHAQLVDRLREEGAALVVFDISFRSPQPDADGAFAEAIRRHGRVILGGVTEATTHQMGKSAGASVVEVRPPVDALREAAAGWGMLLVAGEDGAFGVRRLIAQWKDTPTVPWLAAQHNRVLGEGDDPRADRWINFYGPSPALDQVTLGEVLGLGGRQMPPGCLRGKVVFVGFDSSVTPASGRRDLFATPYTRVGKSLTPGVEICANAYANLANRDWLHRVGMPLQCLLALAFGAVALAAMLLSPRRGLWVAAVILFIAVASASVVAQWKYHTWWNWLAVAGVQLPLTALLVLLFPRLPAVAFVSYRRDGGAAFVKALHEAMLRRHKDTLYDAGLGSGEFPPQIFKMIERTPNVLLVLSPGALDERIQRPEDWLRKEVAHSLAKGKNVVPILLPGFQFHSATAMPEDMKKLPDLQSVTHHADTWDATLDRIESYLRR